MKRAVVTITIGKGVQSQAWYSHPSFRAYAKRIGADFIVFDKQKFPDRHPVYEEFQIKDLINKGYKRILYIDTDAFIKPDCPDLFNIVPYEQIGGVYDNRKNEPGNQDRAVKVQRVLGDIGWEKGYINAGMYVASDVHREIFNIPDKTPNERWWDQNIINYNIHKLRFKIFKLDTKFNAMGLYGYPTNQIKDFDAYIIHYAAQGNIPKKLKFLHEKYKKQLKVLS